MSTPNHEEDASSVISSPTFRIVTTMNYSFFNAQDVQDESKSETYNLIKQWKAINGKLLELHKRRLRQAAESLGWSHVSMRLSSPEVDLETLIDNAADKQSTDSNTPPPETTIIRSTRVRVLISHAGEVDIEFAPRSDESQLMLELPTHIENYTTNPFTLDVPGSCPSLVTIDTLPTPISLFTQHKTTHRAVYNGARSRAHPFILPTHIPTAREVLLFNAQGQIMEASLSTVYFHRNGIWITPIAECGGMQSVTKLYALEKGWCQEGIVRRDEVREGEVIWLSNAVREFFPGLIQLDPQRAETG